jgi:hypothetical protein
MLHELPREGPRSSTQVRYFSHRVFQMPVSQSLLQALLFIPVASILIIGAIFTLAIWPSAARRSRTSVAGAWFAASLVLGYVWYRATCAMPLTCDVGGVAYWHRLVPMMGVCWAVGLGVSGLLAIRFAHRRVWPRYSVAVLGGFATSAGFFVAYFVEVFLNISW